MAFSFMNEDDKWLLDMKVPYSERLEEVGIRIDQPGVCYYVTLNGRDYSRHNDIKAAEAAAIRLKARE